MRRSTSSRGGLFLVFCALALAAMARAVALQWRRGRRRSAAGPDGHEAQRPDVEDSGELDGGDEGATAQVPGARCLTSADRLHGHARARGHRSPRAGRPGHDRWSRGLGGHVAACTNENSNGVPSPRPSPIAFRRRSWNEALTGLRGARHARSSTRTTNAEDVTAQVIDLDARIANARASEAALQAIMARATTIPDVLKVQGELTSVRGDIESMTAQRDSPGRPGCAGHARGHLQTFRSWQRPRSPPVAGTSVARSIGRWRPWFASARASPACLSGW